MDVRPRRFGFVVLEGASQLLDWGVRGCGLHGQAQDAIVRKKTALLLDMYSPAVVVARAVGSANRRRGSEHRSVLEAIKEEVVCRSLNWRVLSPDEVRLFFCDYGATNKYEVATILAEWYPDLSWRLPPKRRLWQSEDYRMSIFDAAAVGTAYFGQPESKQQMA